MSHLNIKSKYLSNISTSNYLNGIIYASPQIAESHIKNANLNNIKKFEFIPPVFNEEKFINFKAIQTKKEFFKKEFNISIKNPPLICMIAHMYKDLSHKNHTIVINAIQKLIQKNKLVQVVFAGAGARENELKLMVKKLNLQEYVHFLGSTNKTPEIIHHSDINLLASNNEAFGIVLLEGALLKKPLICATRTGAANVIIHNDKTGLLFENNNLDSLVEKIETLLNNKQLQKTLGENAYQHVLNNFSTNAIMRKMENFYDQVLKN